LQKNLINNILKKENQTIEKFSIVLQKTAKIRRKNQTIYEG